jgi:3-deoxy-7-phosphoheptulonate synthase
MLLVMKKNATEQEIENVISAIKEQGYLPRPIPGGERMSIGILYNKGPVDGALFLGMPGVQDAIPVTKQYKLVSREIKPEDTVVSVGNVKVGNGNMTIIAGPCAVESEVQAITIAEKVKAAGADMFRGGAFKPRTSPYAFQGLGKEGLRILEKVRKETGLPVATEVVDVTTFDMVEESADLVQIGTRNMQNFSLLKRAGASKRPILLKRGMAATIEEWLMAAEYILAEGNSQVILCERGVRTFVNHSRNTLDLSAVPVVKSESHLPIIIDPSHAAGKRDQVIPLSRAAMAVEAHGIIVEVHNDPGKAMSDGAQSLYPEQFEQLCKQVKAIYESLKM